MTLHELCDACGVSRRAVQGYEKAGLVQPSGRNERGWLLYDSAAQELIRTIRTYQRFGFPVKEIRLLLSLPPEGVKERLTAQKSLLETERAELEEALSLLNEWIDRLN